MIIGENRVVERGGMLTACGTPDPSGDPNEQAHLVVNRPIEKHGKIHALPDVGYGESIQLTARIHALVADSVHGRTAFPTELVVLWYGGRT
jgi:hypothetical protein